MHIHIRIVYVLYVGFMLSISMYIHLNVFFNQPTSYQESVVQKMDSQKAGFLHRNGDLNSPVVMRELRS